MDIKSKYDKGFIKKYNELFEALETDEDDLENICNGYYQYKKWFFLLLENWFIEIKDNKDVKESNILNYITEDYPKTYITDGNLATFNKQAHELDKILSLSSL